MTSPFQLLRKTMSVAATAAVLIVAPGCGGSKYIISPIVLSVTINQSPISLTPGGSPVYVQVLIVAPTETASFAMTGLPEGVSQSYKESESNPSGQLTLVANLSTPPGSYKCTVTVGSSGQMASTVVTVVVAAAAKA